MDIDTDVVLRNHQREALRWLRQDLGMSQATLAKHLGIPQASLARWEVEKTTMSPVFRREVGRVLAPRLASDEGRRFLERLLHRDTLALAAQRAEAEEESG